MTGGIRLLHECGCVLLRLDPACAFAACPVHGFGQEALGLVHLREVLQRRVYATGVVTFNCARLKEGPRPSTSTPSSALPTRGKARP